MNRNRLIKQLDSHWFVVLLGAGTALSCLVRGFGELFEGTNTSTIAALISIGICLACLVFYYRIARRDSTDLHNPDNLYYMGLLFTLTSLVYSLITLFLLNGDGDITERTYNLIGSFGIALVSTFFGILLRILLLQELENRDLPPNLPPPPGEGSHDDFNQLRQSAHADLTETARKLRMELTQTIADMVVFRRAIVQATNETMQETKKAQSAMIQQIEKAATEQTRILSTLSTTTVDKLGAIFDGVTASVENIQKSLDDIAEKQSKRVQQLIVLAETNTADVEQGLQNSLSQIAHSTAAIKTAFGAVLTALQGVADNLQSTTSNTENLANQYVSLNTNLQQSLNFFTDIEGQMKQAANALAASTQGFSNVLADATNVTPQYTQQFEQLTMTLRQEAEQWQSMTQEVRSSLVQAVNELTQLVKRN